VLRRRKVVCHGAGLVGRRDDAGLPDHRGRKSGIGSGAIEADGLILAGGSASGGITVEGRMDSFRPKPQERADLAARVRDSVLQTLALIQKDPGNARKLARRQERELRAWLYPDREPTAEGTLAGAVEQAAAEIEELHGVRVEVVHTGDAPLDERSRALVLAGREAMANAAKHSGADEVSVFVDAAPERVALYVRDRGAGFDVDAVAADRRGISESIVGRMTRNAGTAAVRTSPGHGTEVELIMTRVTQ